MGRPKSTNPSQAKWYIGGKCSVCGEIKGAEEFRWNMSQCKDCQRITTRRSQRKRRATNPRMNLAQTLWNEYKLPLTKYEEILAAQNGHCALCERTDVEVDHDHDTNRLRGLLCGQHNVALGLLGDTADAIRSALAYLDAAKQADAVLLEIRNRRPRQRTRPRATLGGQIQT